MKVYVVEYYGGSYSDYWCSNAGVFSTADKAIEYVKNDKAGNPMFQDAKDNSTGFSIFGVTVNNPDAEREDVKFFLLRPDIQAGSRIKVILELYGHPPVGTIGTVINRIDHHTARVEFRLEGNAIPRQRDVYLRALELVGAEY